MKHILIAVIGNTPQVLTETFWALRVDRKIPIEEVFVFTTSVGKKKCEQLLLKEGRFARLLSDCQIPPNQVTFDAENIIVFAGADGQPLEDIRTSDDNQAARNAIFGWVEKRTRDADVALHGSLAGGRKSMGFLLGAAIQFFGRPQDHLYHILVDPFQVENSISYFYPTPAPEPVIVWNREKNVTEPLIINGKTIITTDVRIELADMPVCRLGNVVQFVSPGRYDEEALILTQQAIEDYARRMRQEYSAKATSGNDDAFPEIVGYSEAIFSLKENIRIFAPFNDSILIVGPTGSGKELVTQAIHKTSARRDKPLVRVNCATLRPELAMSQLFGHVKGAFTGAVRNEIGFFEQANGGTLFLDEINSLLPEVQAMLLRVMEDGNVPRLGGETVHVDVRLIAATNEDPNALVRQGTFRGDLKQRFEVVLEIPALKTRLRDILLLAIHFLTQFNKERGAHLIFDAGMMTAMQTYNWPGNVRELRNVIRSAGARALAFGTDLITPQMAFPAENLSERQAETGLQNERSQLEKERIKEALDLSEGNLTNAAKILRVSRSTASRKAKKYGLK